MRRNYENISRILQYTFPIFVRCSSECFKAVETVSSVLTLLLIFFPLREENDMVFASEFFPNFKIFSNLEHVEGTFGYITEILF